jgi:hypothetical protein
MTRVAEVADFVGNHVVDASRWGVDEFWSECNFAVAVCASPALWHAADQELRFGKLVAAAPVTPGIKPSLELLPRLCPKPFVELPADFVRGGSARDDVEVGTLEMDGRQSPHGDFETVLPSKVAVGGTGDKVRRHSCGIHRGKDSPLSLDPLVSLGDLAKDRFRSK